MNMIHTPVTERCIAAYRSSPDLDTACRVAGVHKLTMFKILKFSGVMLIADRLKMGTPGGRLGASGEQEFQRLMPAARSMNAICEGNPGFDFDVHGWRVDVKSASPTKKTGRKTTAKTWQAKICEPDRAPSELVDMFCIFFSHNPAEKMMRAGAYSMFLVPADLVRGRKYLCRTEGQPGPLDEFEVQPADLAAFFEPLEKAA